MTLRIVFHDVGHGQAIHAFMPSGHVVVIDLGCSADFSPLEWLKGQTKTIDKLIITHPHGDHIDEILDIKKHGLNVRQLWRPKWLTAEEIYAANQIEYKEKVDAYLAMSGSYTHPIPDDELIGNPSVTGGAKLKTFASSACGRSNVNNHSGVAVLEYQGLKVVVPGDNEPPSWKELLKNPDFVSAASRADVFLASHHGRESGYHADLFNETVGIKKPRLCVVSDGRVQNTDATNRYSYHASGWVVHSRAGNGSGERLCLTTRTDGHVDVQIGKGQTDGKTFLSVTAG